MRKERAALAALDESEAARDAAVQGRRAAEARSEELAETSPDIVARFDADGTIIHISPACREVLGYEPEELIGRRGDQLVHTEDIPVTVAMRNRAAEVDDVSATFRMVRRDGRPVWVEGKLRIVRDGAGRVVEAHAILRDVHERIEAQRALSEAEERFRTAFEEGAAGMAIISVDGRIMRVNRALCTVTGHQHTDLEGRTMLSLLHPEDRERHTQEAERMLAGRIATARGERRYLHDDGRVVWVAVSTTLVLDAAGKPAALPRPGPGRHGAPPLRGRAAPHGRPRRAHRPAQPPRLRARAQAPRRPRRPLRPARRGRPARRRPVQERQRHARPQRRRPADLQGGRRAARAAARARRDRAPRRRRVRRAAPRRHARRGRAAAEEVLDAIRTRAHLQPVRPAAHGQREHRRRAVRLRPPDRRGRARQRRPRDVRGQGGRPRPGRLPRRQQRQRLPPRLAAVVDRRDPRRARRGAPGAAGPADHGPRTRARSTSTRCCCACGTRSAS